MTDNTERPIREHTKPKRVKVRRKTFKVRGTMVDNFHLSVPAWMGRRIDPEVEFIPELTEDGILYRVVESGANDEAPPPMPEWTRG